MVFDVYSTLSSTILQPVSFMLIKKQRLQLKFVGTLGSTKLEVKPMRNLMPGRILQTSAQLSLC